MKQDTLHGEDEFRALKKNLGIMEVDDDLIRLALTHRSYAFEMGLSEDNERMEFLGDAVLGFACSRYLYDSHLDADEGELSKMKSKIVSRSLLGKRARDMGLGSFVLLGRGEEISGGRKRITLLGCILEAVIGAVYLSRGLDAAEDFIHTQIFIPARSLLKNDDFADYKSRLQEYVQKMRQNIPQYRVTDESGPDHEKSFSVEVSVEGCVVGTGMGKRKKSAENNAARSAMKKLGLMQKEQS